MRHQQVEAGRWRRTSLAWGLVGAFAVAASCSSEVGIATAEDGSATPSFQAALTAFEVAVETGDQAALTALAGTRGTVAGIGELIRFYQGTDVMFTDFGDLEGGYGASADYRVVCRSGATVEAGIVFGENGDAWEPIIESQAETDLGHAQQEQVEATRERDPDETQYEPSDAPVWHPECPTGK